MLHTSVRYHFLAIAYLCFVACGDHSSHNLHVVGKDTSPLLKLLPSSTVLLSTSAHNLEDAFCSGTYISDGVILTAKHCFENHSYPKRKYKIIFPLHQNSKNKTASYRLIHFEKHPHMDLAIAYFDHDMFEKHYQHIHPHFWPKTTPLYLEPIHHVLEASVEGMGGTGSSADIYPKTHLRRAKVMYIPENQKHRLLEQPIFDLLYSKYKSKPLYSRRKTNVHSEWDDPQKSYIITLNDELESFTNIFLCEGDSGGPVYANINDTIYVIGIMEGTNGYKRISEVLEDLNEEPKSQEPKSDDDNPQKIRLNFIERFFLDARIYPKTYCGDLGTTPPFYPFKSWFEHHIDKHPLKGGLVSTPTDTAPFWQKLMDYLFR